MLNISSILKYMHENLMHYPDRYVIVNSEHIMDTKTGLEYHMYDDYLKVTRNDEKVMKLGDFTSEEQQHLWGIKGLITDPVEAKQKEQEYPEKLKERREMFAHYHEHPEPLIMKSPVMESDTEEYTG